MTFDSLKIESAMQNEVASRYGRLLAGMGEIDRILDSHVERLNLLISTLKQVFHSYGHVWAGKDLDASSGPARPIDPELSRALSSLSKKSRYLSLHLFDSLDHQRRSITSLLAKRTVTGELGKSERFTVDKYRATEALYLGLANARPPVTTLVGWIHSTLSDPKSQRNFAFRLARKSDTELPDPWKNVTFPFDYTESVFASSPVLAGLLSGKAKKLESQATAAAIHQAINGSVPSEFCDELTGVIGVRPQEKQAAEIALALQIWESTIGIMPYYFRGIAWTLPEFSAFITSDTEKRPTFLAISCSTSEDGLDTAHLQLLNSVARGLASAISICSIELARSIRSKVYLPKMLEHEIGSELLGISERLEAFVEYIPAHSFEKETGKLRTILDSIYKEIAYVNWSYKRLLENADPDGVPKGVQESETREMWPDVFSQMIRRAKPAMDQVSVMIAGDESTVSLELNSPSAHEELAELPWPPPLAISRHYLRRLLVILINNARNRANAKKIQVRISTAPRAKDYLSIAVWDDGYPYLHAEDESQIRIRFGHRIIDAIIAALRNNGFKSAQFIRPKVNSSGEAKIFTLILPVGTQDYVSTLVHR
jgi:signal transduction histidine kinase